MTDYSLDLKVGDTFTDSATYKTWALPPSILIVAGELEPYKQTNVYNFMNFKLDTRGLERGVIPFDDVRFGCVNVESNGIRLLHELSGLQFNKFIEYSNLKLKDYFSEAGIDIKILSRGSRD